MKINKLAVHNYRSIRDLEINCESQLVMIGPNNHGKSNILSAIEFALTTSARPSRAEFCFFRDGEDMLWTEVEFKNLTDQEKVTFRKYLRADTTVRFRKSAQLAENGSVEISYNGYVYEPTEPWLQSDNIGDLTKRENINATPLKDLVPSSGRLTRDDVRQAQEVYIKENSSQLEFTERFETGSFLGQKNVGGGVLPDFYLIPAVRDLSDETRIKNTTSFGRLLNRAVREMAERDPHFRELREGLDRLIKSLNRSEGSNDDRPEQLVSIEKSLKDELGPWGVNVEIEVLPPEIEKIFELGTNLHLDDGVKTLAEQKGHGLQRAVIFALVRAWANALRSTPTEDGVTVPRASSESVIFAMEEPELFLHPHAQRRLARAMREISESPDHQVFICSHSTHFVDLSRYKSICIVKKPTPEVGTKVDQCFTDLFEDDSLAQRKHRFHMAHWVNPDRGEMFFAKKIALVEGETEKVLLPFLADKIGCIDHEVSIIECGSKHNLQLYITISNAFKIPYVVLYDEDPLPDPISSTWDENKKREKKRTFELNKEIEQFVDSTIGKTIMLVPNFEDAFGISNTQGDKKGKALAAMDVYENKNVEDISQSVKDIVKSVYCS